MVLSLSPLHACPCCGFSGLTEPPYRNIDFPPWGERGQPPYCLHWGEPSYEVCLCCGFEFGNDDDPGTGHPSSFEQYLAEWMAAGCHWFAHMEQPSSWSLLPQLEAVGIPMP